MSPHITRRILLGLLFLEYQSTRKGGPFATNPFVRYGLCTKNEMKAYVPMLQACVYEVGSREPQPEHQRDGDTGTLFISLCVPLSIVAEMMKHAFCCPLCAPAGFAMCPHEMRCRRGHLRARMQLDSRAGVFVLFVRIVRPHHGLTLRITPHAAYAQSNPHCSGAGRARP